MRVLLSMLLAGLLAAPATAAELKLGVQIPTLKVAEYHRPYVAAWIEGANSTHVANLVVWYQVRDEKEPGTKWLPDLRQWWRRSGRSEKMPIDGVSGATRAAGVHTMAFSGTKPPLARLKPGQYTLVVEAVREVGGRELLRIPFQWPAAAREHLQAQGEHELGTVTLDLAP